MERRPTPMHCQVRPAEIMRQAIPPRAPFVRTNAPACQHSYRRRALPDSDFSARCLAAHGRHDTGDMDETFIRVIAQPAVEPAWPGAGDQPWHIATYRAGTPAARVGQSARPARQTASAATFRPTISTPCLRWRARPDCSSRSTGRSAAKSTRASRPGARVATVRRGTLRAGRTDAPADAEPRRKARPAGRTRTACATHVQRVRAAASGISVRGCAALPPTARPAVDASLHLNMQACRCTAREPCNG